MKHYHVWFDAVQPAIACHLCVFPSVFQLGRPVKYEQLRAILHKYFNITEDVTCHALHGDDVRYLRFVCCYSGNVSVWKQYEVLICLSAASFDDLWARCRISATERKQSDWLSSIMARCSTEWPLCHLVNAVKHTASLCSSSCPCSLWFSSLFYPSSLKISAVMS